MRLTLPLGPSNIYALSTATHGIRRRSAANASWARVSAFSLTRSCSRAALHSCGDTIGGVFMVCGPSLRRFLAGVVMVIATSEVEVQSRRKWVNCGSNKCDVIDVIG